MQKLDFNDIQKFYDCYQEQIGPSNMVTMTDQKIDEICDRTIIDIENIRKISKSLKGQAGVNTAILTLLLEQNCLTEVLKMAEEIIKPDCGLGYSPLDKPNQPTSLEHKMWGWAVFFTSWTLRNLKGKVEVGSCHNEAHRLQDTRMHCPQGSNFHLDFYNECLQSFKDIINSVETKPPIGTDLLVPKYYKENPAELSKLVKNIIKAI